MSYSAFSAANAPLLNAVWHYNSNGPEPANNESENSDRKTIFEDYNDIGNAFVAEYDSGILPVATTLSIRNIVQGINGAFYFHTGINAISFDVEAVDGQGNSVQPNGNILLKFHKDMFSGPLNRIRICHKPADGTPEIFSAGSGNRPIREYNGYYGIEVSSLSPFIIYYVPVITDNLFVIVKRK